MGQVSIYAYPDNSGTWAVEHIDPDDDGTVEKATFYGYRAENQARSFALAEYGFTEPARRSA